MPILKIGNTPYTILGTKEKMTVADSFVKRANKIMTGNGEAKFYLGNNNHEIRDFFGAQGFYDRCFLLKRDLLTYLIDSKEEYKHPEQPYRNRQNMPEYWEQRWKQVSQLPEILWFHLSEQTQIEGPRIYVKSADKAFDLIRELSLPFITYISAIKLQAPNGDIVYYFRLFVDYFGEAFHPSTEVREEEKIEAENIPEEKKKQLRDARSGQGKYRKGVLAECPVCPITLVSDDRLLIASHIKPWVISDDFEKIDPKNGFMLTPTYDYLFDRGFISFTETKKMLVSPWLSKMTCSKLNIADNKTYPLLPIDGRLNYLEYHHSTIFKA